MKIQQVARPIVEAKKDFLFFDIRDIDSNATDLRAAKARFKWGSTFNGDFTASGHSLQSLAGAPEHIVGDLWVVQTSLSSLVGSPIKRVDGSCYIYDNAISTLEGFPRHIGGDEMYLPGNQLSSLQGIHTHFDRMANLLDVDNNPIKSHVLGVLLLPGLMQIKISRKPLLRNIINKHLQGDKDILACQEELIDNDLDRYAQL